MREVEKSVIGMLTAAALATEEITPESTGPPADLIDALRAPGRSLRAASLALPGDPVPATTVRRLVSQTVEQVSEEMAAHYDQVVAYLVFLFLNLAHEAPIAGERFDLPYFLQWHAAKLESPEGYDEPQS
jgi:hypothetical protein